MSTTKNTFAKGLASTDPKVRESAFKTVSSFFASRETQGLSRIELAKLWKGLYFSMWYCDKAGPQQELAENIGKLFSESIPTKQFPLFLAAFWTIMIREWPTIDQWRIDKYYLLMRRVLRHSFIRLQKNKWDLKLIQQFLSVLSEGPLSGDKSVSSALPYHICDIYVDELELVMFSDPQIQTLQEKVDESQDQTTEEHAEVSASLCEAQKEVVMTVPLTELVSCFELLQENARLKTLREKCMQEVLNDERFVRWQSWRNPRSGSSGDEQISDEESESEEEWKGF